MKTGTECETKLPKNGIYYIAGFACNANLIQLAVHSGLYSGFMNASPDWQLRTALNHVSKALEQLART